MATNKIAVLAAFRMFCLRGAEVSGELLRLAYLSSPTANDETELLQEVKRFRRLCRIVSAAADEAHRASYRLTLESLRSEVQHLDVKGGV